MKKSELRQLIREEAKKMLNETIIVPSRKEFKEMADKDKSMAKKLAQKFKWGIDYKSDVPSYKIYEVLPEEFVKEAKKIGFKVKEGYNSYEGKHSDGSAFDAKDHPSGVYIHIYPPYEVKRI